MRIQFVQHVPFENPGAFVRWAEERGHASGITRFFAGERLPPPEAWDWLVVMGGPMSVHDEKDFPWLVGEKRAIEQAIRAGKTVIGVCLGAQLIADVLGAHVYLNDWREIGWFPIRWTPESRALPLFRAFPDEMAVYHWHGETFELPDGATRLASSAACLNQAFMYGDTVVGFQFHLEMQEENIRLIMEHCAHEMTPGPFVQTKEQMLDGARRYVGEIVAALYDFLDRFERRSTQ